MTHFEVVVAGKTKGNQVRGSKFAIPYVEIMERSNLKPNCWAKCLFNIQTKTDMKHQQLFQNEEGLLMLKNHKNTFYTPLERE